MTYLIPTYKIKIGDFVFGGVNEVRIERDTNKIAAKCTIKVPQTAVLRNEITTATVLETAKAIKRGNKVTVELGYDGANVKEFVGWVHHINHKQPVEIECEDYIFKLKQKQIKKSFTGNLSDAIAHIVDGVGEVKVDPENDDLEIKNLLLATDTGAAISGAQALAKIRDMFGLAVYFDIDGVLYVGLRYKKRYGVVKYALTGPKRNVIDTSDLKYYRADEIALKVQAISIDKTGARTEVSVGDENGSIRTFYYYGIVSNTPTVGETKTAAKKGAKLDLKKIAEAELEKYKFDGYTGNIETFLTPNAQPGMVAQVIDPDYPEREGKYYIEAVNTSLSQGGGRKEVKIAIEV